jgi:hypothetical protein
MKFFSLLVQGILWWRLDIWKIWAPQEVEAPRFQDNRHMKVVSCQPYAPATFTPPETFLVLISVRCLSRPQDRSAAGRPARPQTQHDCHHDTKVKPEPVTAVMELLMMGGKTPETCWAVNKRQDNKLKNCCIWLVIFLSSTPNFLIPPLFYMRSKSLKFATRSSLWEYVPKLQVNRKWVEEKSGLVTEVVLA